jgi:hypothetical protein
MAENKWHGGLSGTRSVRALVLPAYTPRAARPYEVADEEAAKEKGGRSSSYLKKLAGREMQLYPTQR